MYRYKVLFILLFFLSFSQLSFSSEEHDTPAEPYDTQTILLRIKDASSKIETLTGDFIQKKKVEILKDMPDSHGKFFYKKPDCLRWEVTEPVKMGFVVNGSQGKKWRKRDDRYIKFDVSREPIIGVISGQVFSWTMGDFKELEKKYEILILNESPVEVKLLPLSKMEQKYVASIVLTFAVTDDYVECIEINEAKGGCTQVVFKDMAINSPLEESIF